MKLYTYCNSNEASILCSNKREGVKLVDYSYGDYLRFIEGVKNFYLRHYHYWYQTDMSDRDEGSKTCYIGLNYSNIVIRNNELFGILVDTGGMFPSYCILKISLKKEELELGGGYEKNSHDWDLFKHSIDPIAYEYVLVKENINVNINKVNSERKISYYEREIVGILTENLIYKGSEVIGFSYEDRDYLINDESTWESIITRSSEREKEIIESSNIITLNKVTKEFLEKQIFSAPYSFYCKNKNK